MYVTWSVKFISGIIERVIKLLQSSSEVRPLDVAKKCIGKTASKKDVNRYLHYLEKSGFISVKYLNEEKKSNPVWSALPKARDITGIFILDINSHIESLYLIFCKHQREKKYSVKHLSLNKAFCIVIWEQFTVYDF